MANSQRGRPIFSNRTCNFSRVREYNNRFSYCRDNTNKRINKNFRSVAIILLIGGQTPVVANTTVASPSSNSSGVVNNNATQIIPSSGVTNRFSQGIQCVSPNVSLSPYVVNSHSFARPKETITRTPIYDDETGDIIYYSEIPRFEKDNYALNWGASIQFNIPFGRGVDLCHQAVRTNLKNQELLFKKTTLEVSLHRLKICAEQYKLGVRYRPGSPSAVTCEDIELYPVPGVVEPHTHSITFETPSASSSSQQQKEP